MILNEVISRPDIKRAARGFAFKKYLGKHVDAVKASFDKSANKKLKHHSTMSDGRHVYHGIDADGHHHYMLTDHNHHVQAAVNMIKKGRSYGIDMAVSKPGANVHHMYHHLITKHNHILTSKEQSPGGHVIWQKLRRMGGVNIHGYHPKSGKGEHIDIQDPEETHVSKADLKTERQGRGGGTRVQRKKEYADLKKTQSMILVAHKDKNIKPSTAKPVRESATSTILRVVKESIGI